MVMVMVILAASRCHDSLCRYVHRRVLAGVEAEKLSQDVCMSTQSKKVDANCDSISLAIN